MSVVKLVMTCDEIKAGKTGSIKSELTGCLAYLVETIESPNSHIKFKFCGHPSKRKILEDVLIANGSSIPNASCYNSLSGGIHCVCLHNGYKPLLSGNTLLVIAIIRDTFRRIQEKTNIEEAIEIIFDCYGGQLREKATSPDMRKKYMAIMTSVRRV